MTKAAAAVAVIFMVPGLVMADEHMHAMAPPASAPPITININPEARVSVALGGSLPPSVVCGQPAILTVKIVNQGFVTSQLEAELVEDMPSIAKLEFHPAPLKGVPEELRDLRITLAKPGLTDLTIAFRSRNEAADIGGRDRVHFLMKCVLNKTNMP